MRPRRRALPTGPALSPEAVRYLLDATSPPPPKRGRRPKDWMALFAGGDPACAACWQKNEPFLLAEATRLGVQRPREGNDPFPDRKLFHGEWCGALRRMARGAS